MLGADDKWNVFSAAAPRVASFASGEGILLKLHMPVAAGRGMLWVACKWSQR